MKHNEDESPFATPVSSAAKAGKSRAPQISLARMMLIMTVAAIAAAPLAYLARAMRGSRHSHFVFLLLGVATPSLLLVIVSVALRLFRRK